MEKPARFSVDPNWIILTLLALMAWAPLTYPGFIQTHSGYLSIYQAEDLARAADPWGWAPHIGQAFDPWRSEGRLPFLVAALAIRAGMSGAAAVRLAFACGLALGSWGMYVWARRSLSPPAALLAAVVYTFLPWVLATAYLRGALGEVWVYGLAPWALWGIGRAAGRAAWVTAAAAAALLFWSQAGLAVCALVMISLMMAATSRGRPALIALSALAAGAAVGVIGLIPWLRQAAAGANPDFDQHFLYLFQLLLPTWGDGASRPGWQDEMTFQLGTLALGLILLAILGGRPSADQPPASRAVFRFALSATGLLAALTLGWAAPLWQLSGVSRLLSYPWQLLTVTAPWLSLAAGTASDRLPLPRAWPRAIVLIGLAIVASYPYLDVKFAPPPPATQPVAILGENQIALVDARVEGEIRAGGALTVTLTWQALRPIDLDYTVFIHAVDDQGQIVAQRDRQPQDDQHPTNAWREGEIIVDPHPLALPTTGAAPVAIHLGLYDWRTGQRLRVGEGDFVRLALHAP